MEASGSHHNTDILRPLNISLLQLMLADSFATHTGKMSEDTQKQRKEVEGSHVTTAPRRLEVPLATSSIYFAW